MADNAFNIKIVADLTQSVKAIEDFSKQTNKSVDSISKAFTGIKVAAGAFVATLASRAVVDFFGRAIKEATEAEDAFNQLRGAFEASGIAGQKAADDFSEFADSIQLVTKYGDDQIIQFGAQLQALGNFTTNGLKVATKAALDFSAFYGVDATTAIQIFGKAAQGEIGTLSRYGIKVKEGSDNAQTFANVLEAVARSQGAAAREGQTFTGQIAQLNNIIGNTFEEFGKVIITNKELAKSLSVVRQTFLNIQSVLIGNADILGTIFTFALQVAADAVVGFVGSIEYLYINGQRLFILFRKAFDIFISNLFSGIEGILDLASKLPGVGDKFDSIRRTLNRTIVKAQLDIIELDQTVGGLEKRGIISLGQGQAPLTKSIKESTQSLGAMFNEIKKTDKGAKDAEETFKKLNDKLKDSSKDLITFIKSFDELKKGGVGGAKLAAAGGQALLSTVTQGAKGATDLIAGGLGIIGDSLLPGIGGFVSQIATFLAMGPEKVRQTIQEFARAIPVVIENIILAIPVLIQTIAEEMPALVERLNTLIPRLLPTLITTFAKLAPVLAVSLAAQAPLIATSFAVEFVKQAPAIAQALIEAAKGLIPGASTVSKVVSGGGGFLSGIGDFFGFAEGGMVPQGFPNDTFPARLTSGEAIVPNNVVDKLEAFLNGGGGQSQNVTINLQVGEQQLANVLLNLNRRGFRTQ